jgi:hypothetical protein
MAMKIRADVTSKLLVPAVAAVFTVLSFSAFAGDPVKTRSDYSKPGRQIEEGAPVKTSDASKSFWRGIDDEGKPVKTGDGTKKFGRTADEGGPPVKTRGATNIPGRALNQDRAKNKAKPIEE